MRLLYEVPVPPQVAVVAAKLLVSFATVVTGFVLWGMHASFPSWVRALLTTLTHKQKGESLFKTLVYSTPRLAASGILWVYHQFHHHVSHAVALKSGPVSSWLDGGTELWHAHTNAIARTFEMTAVSLEAMRARVIPRQIHKAVHPVAQVAAHADRAARRSISLEIKDRRDIGRGIDRLKRRGLWPIAAGLAGIDVLLRDHVRPEQKAQGKALGHIRTHDLPHVRTRLGNLERGKVSNRSRTWKKVARLATTAGLVAAVRLALGRIWPWTRCNNFSRLSKLLRCSHFGFLADLLVLGLSFLAVTDAKVVARAALEVEDVLDGTIRALAAPSSEVTAATEAAMKLLTGFR